MNNSRKYNYFFSRLWHLSAIYFTNWMLVLNALYYFGILKQFQESILLITITVAFIGSVLVYIYPRKIVLRNVDIEIEGTEYQLIDLTCHLLPLILLLLCYNPKIKPDNLIFGVSLLLIYMLIYNPLKIYSYDKNLNNIPVKTTNSKSHFLKPYLSGNKRYHVGVFMIFSYLIILMIAIKMGVFK